MKVDKNSPDYLKSTRTGGTYSTYNGTETIRELHISGSEDRVKSQAPWIKGKLLP